MNSYQKLKKDRDLLSKEFKIAREAMEKYLSKTKGPYTEKDMIIINGVLKYGELMTKHETD